MLLLGAWATFVVSISHDSISRFCHIPPIPYAALSPVAQHVPTPGGIKLSPQHYHNSLLVFHYGARLDSAKVYNRPRTVPPPYTLHFGMVGVLVQSLKAIQPTLGEETPGAWCRMVGSGFPMFPNAVYL
jgi:hypothetical protein